MTYVNAEKIKEYLITTYIDEKLREAARNPMTPRDIWQQRVSFVYGQAMKLGSTREEVEARAVSVYGPCPEE